MVLYELPAEILLQILSYTDIPELLSLSRVGMFCLDCNILQSLLSLHAPLFESDGLDKDPFCSSMRLAMT